ncbi:hypothetical protein GQ53DRAFT_831536 [Thozetella sp. PMI_491]|nr:hypothetical protein GQ53DRAFT_831536 [Thozetella sp. PMI_491]
MNSSPGVALSRAALKPCIHCRKRKVKCDRGNPCAECVRFAKACSYEDTVADTNAREPHAQDQGDLQHRLDRLEKLLEEKEAKAAFPESHQRSIAKTGQMLPEPSSFVQTALHLVANSSEDESGVLMTASGTTLYVAGGFWAKLFEETDELHMLLQPLQHPAATLSPPIHSHDPTLDLSLDTPHPSIQQADVLCNLFFARVEPFIRILHEPTFRKEYRSLQLGKCSTPDEFEALLSAIYLLTILVTDKSMVQDIFGQPKAEVLCRSRRFAEASLSRIGFMRSRSMLSFQALLYHITFLYEAGDYETATSMVGLAQQISRRLGLHRDASASVDPFAFEIRKRAANHLAFLVYRGYENEGIDCIIPIASVMNLAPMNADDITWEEWLYTKFAPRPVGKQGYTDMTFAVVRPQLALLMTSMLTQIAHLTTEQSAALLGQARTELTLRYTQHFDLDQPMQKLVEGYIRLYLETIKLAVDIGHVKHGREGGTEFKNRQADLGIFFRATHILAEVEAIEAEAGTFGWAWIFRACPHWHATAALLCHIAHRLDCFTPQDVDRAWRQVEIFFRRHDNAEFSVRASPAWQVMEHFRQMAKDRQAAACLQRADMDWNSLLQLDQDIDFRDGTGLAPSEFQL